ncbi:hypothetical protein ZIOFF_008912 [Zingiber officinale]|uniref:Uncharacterized protein n=1 Tax=Zingiber officinale TaxID=94328 RepID=A0A8J5HWU1_ZINOF|nr:hypothetical protein ZIOFF_008912 [Zingiber officinale]
MDSASPNHLEFDYLFKLLLIDDSSVVKSSHLLRFTSDFLDHAEVADLTTGNDGEQAVGFLESFTTMDSTSLNHLKFDYLFKLLFIGDSSVVKSNYLLRFTSNSFEDIFPTIGALRFLPLILFPSLIINEKSSRF